MHHKHSTPRVRRPESPGASCAAGLHFTVQYTLPRTASSLPGQRTASPYQPETKSLRRSKPSAHPATYQAVEAMIAPIVA